MTPLYHAVMQNNEAICRILLDGGADPDITDACGGIVPLPWVESCKLLIDAGANRCRGHRCGGRHTPEALMMAAARGREPITRMLLDAPAPTRLSTRRRTPTTSFAARTPSTALHLRTSLHRPSHPRG